MSTPEVFITGGTGYLGRSLIEALVARGIPVAALARQGSERKLPHGCRVVIGDVFRPASYAEAIARESTLVPLVGTAKPAPWKGSEIRAIDGAYLAAALEAGQRASVRQVVYVSVAHPAPVMRAYIAVRAECELSLRASGLAATILRPWYVLGPGHRWPLALAPLYWLAERLPPTRAGAQRLGLVTWQEMRAALLWAIENPAEGVRVLDVPALRRVSRNSGLDPRP